MTDKKKVYPKVEKPEIDMNNTEMSENEMPVLGGMCPFMQGYPMMCPMMCPLMYGQIWQMPEYEEQIMEAEDMRSPYWYDEDDSDYSSDESDEYPGHWKHKKKYKYHPYPILWPPYYPVKPYKKKHKKW